MAVITRVSPDTDILDKPIGLFSKSSKSPLVAMADKLEASAFLLISVVFV